MSRKKVLIVDDDEVIRTGLALKLQHHGYDVLTAVDGSEAVSTARHEPQVYGTQLDVVAGRAVLKPIRDSAHVDARRAAVGLPPLRDYLRVIDSIYTPRPQH